VVGVVTVPLTLRSVLSPYQFARYNRHSFKDVGG